MILKQKEEELKAGRRASFGEMLQVSRIE